MLIAPLCSNLANGVLRCIVLAAMQRRPDDPVDTPVVGGALLSARHRASRSPGTDRHRVPPG